MHVTQRIQHHDHELLWQVDIGLVQTMLGWARRQPAVLSSDLDGMQTFFPHWLLVGAHNHKPVGCAACGLPGVPSHGAIRCAGCARVLQASTLAWQGDIPALARPEPRFQQRLKALRAAGFGDAQAGAHRYVLVPLVACYPDEWPHEAPAIWYSPRWLETLGLPASSAAHHVIGGGMACIYAWRQWQCASIHTVLQQRVVNHIASLLKIVAGQSPEEAFIGRIHHNDWTPRA